MKKLVLLFYTFATFVLATPSLLGAKECTYGPTFWCNSLGNAKKCAAVPHCIQTIWEKTTLPEDNDGVCDLCKEMIVEAKKALRSDVTNEEIKHVVKQYCQMIPLKSIQLECITVVDDYIEELIQTFTSSMNPHIICATIRLCNSVTVDKLLLKNKISPDEKFVTKKPQDGSVSDLDCELCKDYFAEVISIIKGIPKDEVMNALLSICNRMGSFSDSCKANVQKYFPEIYDFITSLTPDSACKLIGVCNVDDHGLFTFTSIKNNEPCNYCMAAITFWRQMLVSNTTREEFREMLLTFCDQTGSFKTECHDLVEQYYDLVYDTLVSDLKPKAVCEAVGLCGLHSIFNSEQPVWTLFDLNPINKLPLPEDKHIVGTDEAASYASPHLTEVKLSKTNIDVSSHGDSGLLKTNKNLQNKDLCIMCEFVLHFLQNVLQDKPTRREVIEELDHICTLMPKSVAEECQDYVDAYGDQLISLIIMELDPSIICPDLHICPGVSNTLLSDSTCVMCEFAITQLEEMLKDNKTEESIKHALESVCSIMPNSIRSQCVDFIDQYYDQLIGLLISELTPDEVCRELGLCKNQSKVSSLPFPKNAQLPISRLFAPGSIEEPKFQMKQSGACVICEVIVRELDKLLLDNATVLHIEDAFAKVCFVLPSTLQNDCLGFIEEYAKPLMEMLIAKELKPDFICRELRLCRDTFIDGMPKAIVRQPKPDPLECVKCLDVLEFVKAYYEIFGVNATVEVVIDKLCPLTDDIAKCIDFVEKNGARLIPKLNKYSVEKICKMEGYCPQKDQNLLSTSKCTWGPAYWCKSLLHAARCKSMKHCKERVWGNSIPPV